MALPSCTVASGVMASHAGPAHGGGRGAVGGVVGVGVVGGCGMCSGAVDGSGGVVRKGTMKRTRVTMMRATARAGLKRLLGGGVRRSRTCSRTRIVGGAWGRPPRAVNSKDQDLSSQKSRPRARPPKQRETRSESSGANSSSRVCVLLRLTPRRVRGAISGITCEGEVVRAREADSRPTALVTTKSYTSAHSTCSGPSPREWRLWMAASLPLSSTAVAHTWKRLRWQAPTAARKVTITWCARDHPLP